MIFDNRPDRRMCQISRIVSRSIANKFSALLIILVQTIECSYPHHSGIILTTRADKIRRYAACIARNISEIMKLISCNTEQSVFPTSHPYPRLGIFVYTDYFPLFYRTGQPLVLCQLICSVRCSGPQITLRIT